MRIEVGAGNRYHPNKRLQMLLLRLESVSKEAVAEDLKDSEESFVVDWRKRQDGSKTISCR